MASLPAYQENCARLACYIEEASKILRSNDVAILRRLQQDAQRLCDDFKSREHVLVEAEQSNLRTQLSELQTSVASMATSVLLDQRTELERVINEVRTETAVKDQLAELRTSYADAKSQLKQSEGQLEDIRNQLNQADTGLRSLQLQHDQLKAKYNKMDGQLTEARNQVSSKDTELNQIRVSHQQAKDHQNTAESKVEKLRAESSQKSTDIDALRLERDKLRRESGQLRTQLEEAKTTSTQKDQGVAQAQQDVEKLQGKLKTSDEQFKEKSFLVDTLLGDVDKLKMELAGSRSGESSLSWKLGKAEATKSQLRSQLETAQAQLRRKDAELAGRQQQIDQLRTELEAAAHDHLVEMMAEAVNASTTIGKLQGEVDLLSTHLTVSKNEGERKTRTIGRLEGQLSEATKARDGFAKDANAARTLGSQLAEARSTAEKYGHDLGEKSEALAEVGRQLAEANEREAVLKDQVTSLEMSNTEYQKRDLRDTHEYFSKRDRLALVSPDVDDWGYQQEALDDFLRKYRPLVADDSMPRMQAALFLYSEVINDESRRSRLALFHIHADLDCWYCFEAVASMSAASGSGRIRDGEPCLIHGVHEDCF